MNRINLSGDDQRVRIWEVATSNCLQELHHPSGKWGQVTSLIWVFYGPPTLTEERYFLCIGGGRGTVTLAPMKQDTGVRTIPCSATMTLIFFHSG